ncbi:DNA-directed RNA polymerase II subunit RPB1-like [Rhopalosiphum maidis]|uniref:DNA-directed RNA polymerase II subunit RPB1-like n=1 Tax=Rhopalosiphum maidis TaxID=43146 RepID=UPI000EFE42C5|nr:DNA-directed RNA polymerase II subunit RPB1-like [Rhopalosiphum maidis]
MNHFRYYAVAFVFVIACNYIAHGLHISDIDLTQYHWESMADVQTYDPRTYHLEYIQDLCKRRRKRGFFSMPFTKSVEGDEEETATTITTSDTDTDTDADADTTTRTFANKIAETAAKVQAAYWDFMNSAQSKMTHIVSIGTDVKRSLVVAAPYLPLVNKVATYIVPDLSQRDVLTLSVNVAVLTTQGIKNYSSTEVTESSSELNVGATISQYANGIYNKLKYAFKSKFGDVLDNSSDEEKPHSPEETHSIFDTVKSKMNIFSSFKNSYDSPITENNDDQIETTIVTHTYIDDSQTPTTNTIVTKTSKTYESSAEPIIQTSNGETKHVILSNKLLQNGKHNVNRVITEMKNDSNNDENSANESYEYDDDDDFEAYDDDNDDTSMNVDDENMINDNNVEINENDLKEVMQESMKLQPDFVQKLDGEELLKQIDESQKSLPNPKTDNRKIFNALIEELDIDQRVSDDKVNELINGLEKITNYFISSGIKKNEILTTPPTLPMN